VKDLAGNPLAADKSWSFTTVAAGSATTNSATSAANARPSTTAPTTPAIIAVTPAEDAGNVSANAIATATFSKALDPSTVNTSTVTLVVDGSASPVAVTVTYDKGTHVVTVVPKKPLDTGVTGTIYKVTIKGGSNGIKDTTEDALATDKEWTFTTTVNTK
jgi:hypothetical protein